MSKSNIKILKDVSSYVISPVTDNPFILHVVKLGSNTIHLATLKLENKNVIITLSKEFEDWYFNSNKKDYEEFLFSLWMAEGLLQQNKEA